MTSKEQAMQELAGLIDSLDNYAHALAVALPDSLHVECLRAALPKLVSELKREYVNAGGESPWRLH
jgi:hypothetical protein